MKIKRTIVNCLGMTVATNIIHVHSVRTLREYCIQLGGFMHLGGKEFSIKTGPQLNQVTTKYRLMK